MRKSYERLQKKLKDEFVTSGNDYGIATAIQDWCTQSGILKKLAECRKIIVLINGLKIPYPYKKNDRKVILKYLKKNSYEDFEKKLLKPHLKRIKKLRGK